ncbi:MAG: hypothetical protein ACTSWY_10960, partial [Promethearchaeota archaeon]
MKKIKFMSSIYYSMPLRLYVFSEVESVQARISNKSKKNIFLISNEENNNLYVYKEQYSQGRIDFLNGNIKSEIIIINDLDYSEENKKELKKIKKFIFNQFSRLKGRKEEIQIKKGAGIQLPPISEKLKEKSNLKVSSEKLILQKHIKNKNKDKKVYDSSKDLELEIPNAPLKKIIEIDTKDLKKRFISSQEYKNSNVKTILVECDFCNQIIKMAVPRDLIENSELPVTPITYIHG